MDQQSQSEKSGWYLEKSVSIGHIISTVAFIVSALWWAATVETRIALNAQRIGNLDYSIRKYEESNIEMRKEIKADLRDIKADFDSVHDKLDLMRYPRGR